MRVLAFTDTNGSLSALRVLKRKAAKADFILCAGDVSVFQQRLFFLLRRINSFGKPVFIIPGNHEDAGSLEKLCSRLSNLHFIHRKIEMHAGFAIAGYGGGGFSLTDPGLERFARKVPKAENIIFLTHAPPYGTRLDEINGQHSGNKTVRDFIKALKPSLVVCGHLHENFRVQDVIGKSLIINPGPMGRLLYKQ